MNSKKKFSSLTTICFAFITLVFSIFLIMLAFWKTIVLDYLNNVLKAQEVFLSTGASGVILFLFAGRTIWRGLRSTSTINSNHTLIKTGEMGEIHISLEAINNLIIKAASSIKGVKEVKPRIKLLPEGVAILLAVTVNPDLDIPKVTTELQENVSKYLTNYGGIEVLEIKVLVESVKSQNKMSRVD